MWREITWDKGFSETDSSCWIKDELPEAKDSVWSYRHLWDIFSSREKTLGLFFSLKKVDLTYVSSNLDGVNETHKA